MVYEGEQVAPFGVTAIGLTGLGAAAAIVILVWPGPRIDPGGVPTVAFLAFVPFMNALLALALAAFFALPAAVISLVLRESWTAAVVPAAVFDAFVLAAAACVLL